MIGVGDIINVDRGIHYQYTDGRINYHQHSQEHQLSLTQTEASAIIKTDKSIVLNIDRRINTDSGANHHLHSRDDMISLKIDGRIYHQ